MQFIRAKANFLRQGVVGVSREFQERP